MGNDVDLWEMAQICGGNDLIIWQTDYKCGKWLGDLGNGQNNLEMA